MTARNYSINYDEEVQQHLKYIDKKHWSLIRKTIETQLIHQPDVETRNKKSLKRPPVDTRWELRFGPENRFRVFYKIIEKEYEIWILAIGIKIREKLFIGGKEIEL